MCMPNLVPIGPETATCIRLERYTHRHTLSYIDIDNVLLACYTIGYSYYKVLAGLPGFAGIVAAKSYLLLVHFIFRKIILICFL